MIEKTTKVFFCEHCGKHSLSKGAMVNHEKACRKNPANMPMCEKCRLHEGSFKTKEFRYPDPEYDPETSSGLPYISYEIFEETCRATGNKVFHTMSKVKQKTILSQSDWKPCPTVKEGCEHFKKI